MSHQSRKFYHWANSEYRQAIRNRGLCIDCEKSRGETGTNWRCRKCADDLNAKQREQRKAPKWTQIEMETTNEQR